MQTALIFFFASSTRHISWSENNAFCIKYTLAPPAHSLFTVLAFASLWTRACVWVCEWVSMFKTCERYGDAPCKQCASSGWHCCVNKTIASHLPSFAVLHFSDFISKQPSANFVTTWPILSNYAKIYHILVYNYTYNMRIFVGTTNIYIER